MAKGEKIKGFIGKVGVVFPEILSTTAKLVSGNYGGAVNDVINLLSSKKKSQDPEEVNEATKLLNEFELKRIEFELDYFKEELKDTQSARENETNRDISDQTGWLTKNVHELIALVIITVWVFTWFVKPQIEYADITGVVTLILGYLYGRTKPQK